VWSGAPDQAPPSFLAAHNVRTSALAGALLAAGLLLGAAGQDSASTWALVTALVVGGSTFVPSALRGLLQRRLGVGLLMTIAAVGAVLLGELGEAAMLAFLFSISEALEEYALSRSRRGLRALLDLVPPQVTVERDGHEVVIAPQDLVLGDILLARPGERIATDGTILRGTTSLDLSAISGESIPVEVGPGDEVLAASINGTGAIEVQVTARTEDNSLARVVHLIEDAQERKGHSQRLAERIAAPLVPGILVVAAAVALMGSLLGDPEVWLSRSLVVLVAAAPCAFVISVPVTVVAAVGAAARFGVLIKGGAALETFATIEVVAFDKTGTLTRNQPTVVEITPSSGRTAEEVLSVAAALEARSDHPLAGAVLAASPSPPVPAEDVHALVGRGLQGRIGDTSLRLGSPELIEPGSLEPVVARQQADGCTVVLVERAGSVLGAIAIRDELRPETSSVLDRLRHLGVRRTAMLTGDNRRTAAALGRAAGVDEVHAELLPEQKLEQLRALETHGRTAMVGDGINDAPALAAADIGIAMGALGSDVAIETADVALMGDHLDQLPQALAHSRRAGRIMRQNLALSSLILLTLIPLATFGVLGLATVVAVHELAEIVVIANGVRAGRRRPAPVPLSDRMPADPRELASGQPMT
jgi:cation-transporting ATPase G